MRLKQALGAMGGSQVRPGVALPAWRRSEAGSGPWGGAVAWGFLIVVGLIAHAAAAPGGFKAHQASLGIAGILLALLGIAWAAARDGVGALGQEAPSRTELRLATSQSAVLALLLFLGFLSLALAIRLPAVQSFDAAFLRQAYRWGGAMPVTRALSNAGGGKLITWGVPLVCLALWAGGRAGSLRFFLAAMFGTFGVEGLFKTLIHRARPDLVHGHFFNSFPSGHALAAAILAGALLMIALPGCVRPGGRIALWSAAIAWVVLVSGARVCLGNHYLTDVVGGALLGGAWVYGCRALLLRLSPPSAAAERAPVSQQPLLVHGPLEQPAQPLG